MNDKELRNRYVLGMNDRIVKLSSDLSAMQEAIYPFVRLAQSMPLDGETDDQLTSIGSQSAPITVGDLKRLLEVSAK